MPELCVLLLVLSCVAACCSVMVFPSKKLLRLSQQKLRLATGILIGHPQLNPHLKRNGYN